MTAKTMQNDPNDGSIGAGLTCRSFCGLPQRVQYLEDFHDCHMGMRSITQGTCNPYAFPILPNPKFQIFRAKPTVIGRDFYQLLESFVS